LAAAVNEVWLENDPSPQSHQHAELPSEAWSRAANVKMVGKVIERTVLDYATRLVIHERSHVLQIEEIAEVMHI
jgi:hypothetical protein